MKRLYLSPEEKAHLEAYHHGCENRKDGDRIKVILLRSKDWTVPQISQALRLHQTTIIRHIEVVVLSHLNDAQTEELVAHLEEHLYHHNHEIILYVKERWGISYTVPGMHKWL